MKRLAFTGLAFLACGTPLVAQDAPRKIPPVPASIEAALKALKDARPSRATPAAKMDAVLAAGQIADQRLVREIARFARSKHKEVRLEAVRALRYVGCETALEQLIKLTRDKATRKDPALHAATLLAIGQYGESTTVPLLIGNLKQEAREVSRARFVALTHVRHRDSVEGLIDLLNSSRKMTYKAALDGVNRTLYVLTGERFTDAIAWRDWFQKKKKNYQVPGEPRWLNEQERRYYRREWAVPREFARAKLNAKKLKGAKTR